ncbi:MAG: transporter substrate-binding domain-containing protein [Acetobacteraceae bacterium]
MACALGALMLVAVASTARAACPVAAPTDLASAGHLTFGTSAPPPAPGMPPINQTGFEYDFSAAVAQAMCLKPAYTLLTFAGLFPGLDAHKFDAAIAGIGITPQREQSFAFVPYFLGGVRLLVRKDSGLTFKDERDVCGHSIAVLAGSVEAHDIDRVKSECPAGKPIDVRIMPSNNEIVEQLRKGTVQVGFLDWAPVADIVARNSGDFAIGSPILSGDGPDRPRHRVGIMLRKNDTAMKDAIGKALAAMQADGSYDKLLAKWGLQEGDIRKAG